MRGMANYGVSGVDSDLVSEGSASLWTVVAIITI